MGAVSIAAMIVVGFGAQCPSLNEIPLLLLTGAGYNREAVFHYAEEVAAGFRQAIPEEWPLVIRELIEECWHQVHT